MVLKYKRLPMSFPVFNNALAIPTKPINRVHRRVHTNTTYIIHYPVLGIIVRLHTWNKILFVQNKEQALVPSRGT